MDGPDLGSDGRDSGSGVPDSDSASDGRVLVLAGLGLVMDSDGRLVFTADRFSEGLSGGLSEALYSIRTCTGVTATAIRTEVIRITIDESKRLLSGGLFI